MKANVYCGCYKTVHLDPQEHESYSNECCYEGIVELDDEDWEDGCASIKCPACGNTLTQDMDHFTEIEESPNA